jgi:ABC-2 type transport system ATP-binding protein
MGDFEPMFDAERDLLVIPAEDGSQTLIEAVRVMDTASVPIIDIQLHKPTLDDVFLSLTGHIAEPSVPDADVTSEVAR